jgi:hypothetical protein
MKKEFVPYELAVKLKSLGYDGPCFGYYVDGELRGVNLGIEELGGVEPYYQRFGFHTLSNHDIDNPNKIVVTAPTFSQAFRWFRENHNLRGFIGFRPNVKQFDHHIYDMSLSGMEYVKQRTMVEYNKDPLVGTYEEAELACLDKLIEIVENKSE